MKERVWEVSVVPHFELFLKKNDSVGGIHCLLKQSIWNGMEWNGMEEDGGR